MAINKKLIFWNNSSFNPPTSSTDTTQDVLWNTIVFFGPNSGHQKEIWTHGVYFSSPIWGTETADYVPVTISGVTKNLSLNGHTHSYLPLNGGTITGSISVSESITNLSHNGGGIFWNPYAESDTDPSDVASISVNTSGGSTVMSIKQMNDASDYINFLVNSNTNGVRINDNAIYHAGNFNPGNYLSLFGGTMDGPLNFKNNTWNVVGDDVAIGDINVAGQLGIKSLNATNPGIAFYNNSATAVGNLISNAGTLQWNGNSILHIGNYSSYTITTYGGNLDNGLDTLTGTTPWNKRYNPTSDQMISSPVAGLLWHDVFSFCKIGTPLYEISTDNINWTTASLDKNIFSGKESQYINIITNGINCGSRWTWNSGIVWSCIEWLVIGYSHVNGNYPKTILIETSTDGTTWTNIHTSVNDTTNAAPVWYYSPNAGSSNTYLRLTIYIDPSVTGYSCSIATIKALSKRWGNQGLGSEIKYPYTWDYDQNITTGGYIVSNSFRKSGSSDSYVLLGGGGSTLLTSLSVGNSDTLDGQHGTYYLTAGNFTGTLPSSVLGNSALYIGTTSIPLNRASASQTLTGINIDGNAATATNADKLDGQEGAYYHNNVGNIDFATTFPAGYTINSETTATTNPYSITGGNQATILQVIPTNNMYGAQFAIGFGTAYPAWRSHQNSSTWSPWQKISAGYADNAGLLNNMSATTSATANTIVQRDVNGYIYGVYINSSRSNETSAAASYVYDSGDGWLRKKTLANAQAELVTKTQIESVLTGNITSHTHSFINSTDSRYIVTTPETINRGLTLDFKASSTEGLIGEGEWMGELTYRTYGLDTDWSGGPSHQLAFAGTGNLWHRIGSSTTWNSWYKIWDSNNSNLTTIPWSVSTLTMNGALTGATTGSFSSHVRIGGGTANLGWSWDGGIIAGNDGHDKVVATYLASSTNAATIGANNSGLSAWSKLNVAGTSIQFSINETPKMTLDSGGNLGLSGHLGVVLGGRAASFGANSNAPSATIANQTNYIQIVSSGATASTGLVFHNAGISTNALEWVNTDSNTGYFNFKSDDSSWNVRINNNVIWHAGNLTGTQTGHTHNYAALSNLVVAGNEHNWVPNGYSGTMWINYQDRVNRDSTALITEYEFGNGRGGYALIRSNGFVKEGSSDSYVLLGGGGHATISGLSVSHATTATNLSSISTTFTETYPLTVNVSGTIYSHTGMTFNGTTGNLTATSFTGSLIGNATSSTTATTAGSTTVLKWIGDKRTGFKPSDIPTNSLVQAFTSQGTLVSQTGDSDWSDVLGISSYSDSSGGNVNALSFDKSGYRINHFVGTFGTTTWAGYKTLAYTDGTGASGTWNININGSAQTLSNVINGYTGTYGLTVNVSGTLYTNSNLTYNGTTNTLTSPNFAGNLSGTASNATNISNTGTVTLASATESNAITITQPSYATDQPVKLLNFNWYTDAWSIGNIRSDGIASSGLGIFLNSVEKFRFINGVFKIGTNTAYHAGNFSVTLNGTSTTSASFYAPTSQLSVQSAINSYLIGASSTTSLSTVYSNSGIYMNGSKLYTGDIQSSGNITASNLWGIATKDVSLTLTTDWQDTGILMNDSTLFASGSGTYVIELYSNTPGVSSQYEMRYSGVMAVFTSQTNNSTDTDEITLHSMGHASNARQIYLRTALQVTPNYAKIQIASSAAWTGAGTITIKTRRII